MSHATHQIDISADGEDITITIGDYTDADARAAISVTDAGGDGSLAYNNTSGVITYTGPSATEVRAHFSAGTGISIANGVITNTSLNTNTTYTVSAEDGTAGKKIIRLTGSDASTDDVTLVQGSNVTLTRAGDEITIASTDTNTTYGISAETATGGANLRLTGTDSNTDNVKFASGTGMTVSRTDADTINIATTITQYTDTLARQSISVASNTGDGDLTYNNTNGQFSYTGPGTTEYRAAIGVSNASGDGSLAYSTSTGVITYTGPTNSNYRGAVSAANSGTGYGTLSYDSGTGAFTFAKVTGANIRTEVVDGRNLTYTGGGSTLDLDKALVDVNSVTAESATNLTVQGSDLVINTVDVSTASKTLTIGSLGYNFDLNDSGDAGGRISIGSVGTFTKTLYSMLLIGEVTSGSNQITNAMILDNQAVLDSGNPLSWNTYAMSGYPIFDAEDGAGFNYGTVFPLGTTVSSVSVDPGDPTLATLTMSANALQTVTLDFVPYFAYLSHAARSDDWSTAVLVDGFNGSGYTANTIIRTLASAGNASPALVTTNTGYVDADKVFTDNFSWTTTGTAITAGARRVIDLAPTNTINEHVRVPFSLSVGPGAVSTNRGLPSDKQDSIGINLLNNGKVEGYVGKTIFNLTQYKNNSPFNNISTGSPQERAGPAFTFNNFAGNSDTANASLYLTSGDGMGSLNWYATVASSSLASSTFTPANISAKATETHNSTTKQGTGLYLQYTPNSQSAGGRPKTFLRAEDTTTEVLAKTTLKLGKITTGTDTASAGLSATAARTWVTIDDSGLSLNGSTSGSVELAASATGDQLNLLDSASVALVGNKINYNRVYAQFEYNSPVNPVAADTAYVFPLGTATFNNIANVGSTSRLIIGAPGIYNLQFSVQVANADNQEHLAYIWLRKNGTDIANSTGRITVIKSGALIVGWNFMVDSANATDYYEIAYAVSNTNLTFPNYASTAFAPGTATLVTTITPVGA